MKELFQLFGAFFRVGLFTFGGGYSMLPMLEREVIEHYHWATQAELLDCFSISQCTPGVIAVNTATFIGYKRKKFWGALFATLGVILPSIIIITAIAALLENFSELPVIKSAFNGIRIGVAALIASTVIKLFKSNVLAASEEKQTCVALLRNNWMSILLCTAAFALVAIASISPVYVVIGGALTGILLMGRGRRI